MGKSLDPGESPQDFDGPDRRKWHRPQERPCVTPQKLFITPRVSNTLFWKVEKGNHVETIRKGNKERLPIRTRSGNPTEDSSLGRNMIRLKTIFKGSLHKKEKEKENERERERGAGLRETERVKWVMVTTTNRIYSSKVSVDEIELVIKVLGKFWLG